MHASQISRKAAGRAYVAPFAMYAALMKDERGSREQGVANWETALCGRLRCCALRQVWAKGHDFICGGLAKGHDFSRAANACNKDNGFSRCLSPLRVCVRTRLGRR